MPLILPNGDEGADLVVQVRAAFVHACRPATGRGIGGSIYTAIDRCFDGLVGTHWTATRYGDLRVLRSELDCFTPEGFRYFAPAFLHVAVLDPDIGDSLVSAFWLELGGGFWPCEKAAVRAFLRYVRNRWPEARQADDALRYWESFPVRPGDPAREALSHRSQALFGWRPTDWEVYEPRCGDTEDRAMVLRELRDGVGAKLPRFLQGLLSGGHEAHARAAVLLPTDRSDPGGLLALRAQLGAAQRGLVADILELVGGARLTDAERIAVDAFWRSER